MADIGNLVVRLQAQTDAFKRKMNDARSAVGRFSDDAKKKLEVIKKGFNLAGAAIGTLIKTMTAGVGVAAGFFAAMTVKAGAIKELQQLSNVTGVAVENLQRWQFAGKAVGIETDKMGDIMRDAAEKLGELAATGGGEAKEVFEKLGLDARKFANIPVDQALLKIAQRMDGLTQNERNALFEMMASDARELIPLLENNAEKFRELTAEGEKMGAFLSEKAVAGAVRFREKWDDIIQRGQAFITQLTAQMAPVMTVVLERITQWIDEFGGMEKVAERVAKFMIQMIKGMVQGVGHTIKWVNGLSIAWRKVQMATLAATEAALKLAKLNPAGFALNLSGAVDLDKMIENIQGAGTAIAGEVLKLEQFDPNTIPAVQAIDQLLTDMEAAVGKAGSETGNALNSGKKATEDNTKALQSLTTTMGKDAQTSQPRAAMSTTEGGRMAEAWDMLIRRTRTIAGSTQASASDKAVFENAAKAMISRFEGQGGFDTDKMREQMREILSRMGEGAQGMQDTAEALTGDGKKNIGSITINVKSDKGEVSGEVSGDTAFLSKLASTLQSVSAAV